RGAGVQIATDGTTWVAAWLSSVGGGDEDILTARSLDGGATWTVPQLLNTNGATDSGLDTDLRLATGGAGVGQTVWASFDDLGGTIGTDGDSLFARSTDGGATWTTPAPLNTDAAVDAAHDDQPQVAADGAGNWVAVWRSIAPSGPYGRDADILVARSVD